jgi:hypothetical protein
MHSLLLHHILPLHIIILRWTGSPLWISPAIRSFGIESVSIPPFAGGKHGFSLIVSSDAVGRHSHGLGLNILRASKGSIRRLLWLLLLSTRMHRL